MENFGLWSRSDSEDYGAQLLIVYEAPEYVKEELAEADAKLEQKAIGRDALVFIVNEENPVQSLTQQQLRDIYAGRITSWKDVGGADSPIVAFQRGVDSGSQTLFKKLLIDKGDGQLMAAPTELAPADMGGLVDSIAEYNNSANAIGFSVYYYIDQMYSKPGLRLLAVDGVTPGNDTIADESYPLCNEFYAVVHADAAPDSPQRKVSDWLDTDAGGTQVHREGGVCSSGLNLSVIAARCHLPYRGEASAFREASSSPGLPYQGRHDDRRQRRGNRSRCWGPRQPRMQAAAQQELGAATQVRSTSGACQLSKKRPRAGRFYYTTKHHSGVVMSDNTVGCPAGVRAAYFSARRFRPTMPARTTAKLLLMQHPTSTTSGISFTLYWRFPAGSKSGPAWPKPLAGRPCRGRWAAATASA